MSTPLRRHRLASIAGAAGPRRQMLIGAGAVAVALVLVLLDAPVLLRVLVALPVLVLIPGTAGVQLLIGRPTAGNRPGDDDPLLRILLATVLGILFLLASALLVAVVGLRIDTVTVALTTAAGSIILIGAVAWRYRSSPIPAGEPATGTLIGLPIGPIGPKLRRALGGAAGVCVLIAAIAGARALQTPRVEKYTAISFDDPTMLQPGPLNAGPGTAVTLRWTMRSYGQPLSANGMAVTVSVGAVPASDPHIELNPIRGNAGSADTAEQSGAVTFAAPKDTGLYQVDLTVTADDVPYLLETHLEVTR